jgi:hypothetical protein
VLVTDVLCVCGSDLLYPSVYDHPMAEPSAPTASAGSAAPTQPGGPAARGSSQHYRTTPTGQYGSGFPLPSTGYSTPTTQNAYMHSAYVNPQAHASWSSTSMGRLGTRRGLLPILLAAVASSRLSQQPWPSMAAASPQGAAQPWHLHRHGFALASRAASGRARPAITHTHQYSCNRSNTSRALRIHLATR